MNLDGSSGIFVGRPLSQAPPKKFSGILWKNISWFEVEFSEVEENSKTIMFKDPKASRC
jgi:hypothetical protein